jgi:CMP-N-acetylneuraminate monooxygenase
MKPIGKFNDESTIFENIRVELNQLEEGLNVFSEYIIMVKNNKVDYVIDKKCDHNGGKLVVNKNFAICPLHNWKLDLNTLNYNNSNICKKTIDFQVEDNYVCFKLEKFQLKNPFLKFDSEAKSKIRWLNHATIYIECNGVKLITDPWLFGPAFMTGWWLADTSPRDSVELLQSADYLFISHNHPDHLHPETLSTINKTKKIIIPKFKSGSCEKYLKSLGFHNLYLLEFKDIYELTENFQISILKSGDFRDDSGLYINLNGNEIILAVDCNFLNSHQLPKNILLLMTSFASGASGFPLCFDNYIKEEKDKIINRNKGASKYSVEQYIIATNPKYYMPYAGMFSELSERDNFIKLNNKKNKQTDLNQICEKNNVKFILNIHEQYLEVCDQQIKIFSIENLEKMKRENIDFYIQNMKKEYPFDLSKIKIYFSQTNFLSKQILNIIPSDDNFNWDKNSIISYNFFTKNLTILNNEEDVCIKHEDFRVLNIKLRTEVLMCIIENKIPWEDFSIGFQMRVNRYPNEYESDLWYYFTNEHIGVENFRYSIYCGSCTVINQNPIWLK